MAVDENQFEFNGFLFGAGTDHEDADVEGLGAVEGKTEEVPKAGAAGSYLYADPDRVHSRHIFASALYAPSDLSQMYVVMYEDWLTAFELRAEGDELPFRWNLPGIGPKKVLARPVNRDPFKLTTETSKGKWRWLVELVATDPEIVDDV
jgi:hypothetical protein